MIVPSTATLATAPLYSVNHIAPPGPGAITLGELPDEIPDEYCTIGGVDAAAFGAYASATAATAAITKLRSRNSPTNLKTT